MAELLVTITCPTCGRAAVETMPTDRCVIVYECAGCQAVLKPKADDCCVYCSFGNTRCTPVQDDSAAEIVKIGRR